VASVAIVAVPAIALTISMLMLGPALVESTGQEPFGDWRNYRNAVVRVLDGGALYEPQQLAGGYLMPDTTATGYSYPPGSIPWIVPFGLGWWGSVVWTAATVGLFISGLWAALRRDLGARAVVPFAFALMGLILYLPFASAVLSSNVNLFFVGSYAWCWAVGRSEPRVGAMAAIGSLFKLFPSVLVLWPTGRARWRSIAIAGVVLIGSSLLALPLVGWQAFLDFPSVLLNAQPYCTDVRVSIPCALTPILGAFGAKAIAIGIALLALLGALLVRNDRAAFVLFGAAMVAPVSDMHFSYWLFAYVAGVVLIGGLLRRKNRVRVGAQQPIPGPRFVADP
jgi:Glycosyltransferase family 87